MALASSMSELSVCSRSWSGLSLCISRLRHALKSLDHIETFGLLLDSLNLRLGKPHIWKWKFKSWENLNMTRLLDCCVSPGKEVSLQERQDWLFFKWDGREIITKVHTYYWVLHNATIKFCKPIWSNSKARAKCRPTGAVITTSLG